MAALAENCSIMLQRLMSSSESEQFNCVNYVIISSAILTLCLISVHMCVFVLSIVLLLINEVFQYGNIYSFDSIFVFVIISCDRNVKNNIRFASGKLNVVLLRVGRGIAPTVTVDVWYLYCS